jgi:hypothetical protein
MELDLLMDISNQMIRRTSKENDHLNLNPKRKLTRKMSGQEQLVKGEEWT